MRAGIRNAVAARFPVDAREELSQRLFLAHFDALDDPFSEHADPVHVTASAVVASEAGSPTRLGDGHVVLVRHKRLGLWLQPGGHIEPGEMAWEAAVRESTEETGLIVRHPATGPVLCHVDVHPGPKGHTHLDLRYLLVAPQDPPAPAEGESPDVRWCAWADAVELADAGLKGALVALAGDPLPV
jgi:8-oxo-dGTP pyrophosphatase MutT (NUDIX family)